MDTRPKTIFCDIDGTLVKHVPPSTSSTPTHKMELLDGTLEKLLDWDKKGYYIILTTGRKESLRKITEQQLSEVGIFYDSLFFTLASKSNGFVSNNCLVLSCFI